MITLSVIIPTLNEAEHIEHVIHSLDCLDSTLKEILIVDGKSEDDTVNIVKKIALKNQHIKIIENPDRYVSQAFNMAFKMAKGKYISLIGAHAEYPKNYFTTCIRAIESGECDVAGGFLSQRGKTLMGKAIALAMSSRFGVGDTPFRTTRRRMYVDSVAFAVYDRKVFESCGLLDEQLVRNQDDEFHYRLNRAGFRILMLPELEIVYYVRNSIGKLFYQYFQYGYYKPMVLRKVSSEAKLRHFIPTLFVLYLCSLPIGIQLGWWYGLPFLLYLTILGYKSIFTNAHWRVRLALLAVYPTIHIAYGLGFLAGFRKVFQHYGK